MSTQHLHCSPFIPRMLQIPTVPAGWAVVGHHPAGREQEVHTGFPPVKESPAPGVAFWTEPFLVSLLHWQGVPRWEPTMSSFLLSCYLTALFFFPFLQLVDVLVPCHPRDAFLILERWDREKEAVIELQADPAQLGLFLMVSSALWLLTCLYPAASPLKPFDIFSSGPRAFSL